MKCKFSANGICFLSDRNMIECDGEKEKEGCPYWQTPTIVVNTVNTP